MRVTVTKVHETLFDGDAVSVTVPSVNGELTILSNHEPMVTTLKQGMVHLHMSGQDDITLQVDSGVVEVSNSQVTVMV